MYTPSEH